MGLGNKLNQTSTILIDSEKLDIYRKKFSDFFQNLWEHSEIYKMNGVYFCLNSKGVFWIQDLLWKKL
jgi:hypothetical protein